jgi:Ca-activated chloride channel family protein
MKRGRTHVDGSAGLLRQDGSVRDRLRLHGIQFAAACAALLTLSTGRLHGQEGFRFRSGVDLVNVTATVTDGTGRFASGLTQADFLVYEDERPVDITHFSAERVPVSLGIVLDTSGSMLGDKMENALAAIERFLERLLSPDDEVFVYGFSSDVELLQDWTTNRGAVSASLRRVRAAGGTAIYDAMVEAVPMAHRGQNQKKAIVLISDGNDTNSQASIRDVREVVRQTEVLVYAIGIDGQAQTMTSPRPPTFPRAPTPPIPFPFPRGGRPGTRRPPHDAQLPGWRVATERLNVAALREITDDSGGRTEVVHSARDLDPATSSIADELTRQYYLGYPSAGQHDGRWHAIRVEVRDPSLRVRARRGYLAPS